MQNLDLGCLQLEICCIETWSVLKKAHYNQLMSKTWSQVFLMLTNTHHYGSRADHNGEYYSQYPIPSIKLSQQTAI